MAGVTRSSGNVFKDIGFKDAEAEILLGKSTLVLALKRQIALREMTQVEVADRCGVDQPTISKVLSGRLGGVSVERLMIWLRALDAEIGITIVTAPPGGRDKGKIKTVHAPASP